MTTVRFFFGPGSRYSYLASTQIERISRETGAAVDWLPVFSGSLMDRVGNTYLKSKSRSGQYSDEYRALDTARWARLYGIPFKDADVTDVDWSLIVRACLAAKQLGAIAEFARVMYSQTFGLGSVPRSLELLAAIAEDVGLDRPSFEHLVAARETFNREGEVLESALSAGAFGVPTFVVGDELFWGQDRIPLLVHYLKNYKRTAE